MQTRGRWVQSRCTALLAAVTVPLLIGACRDEQRTVAGPTPLAADVIVDVAPTDGWDSYSADVQVTLSGAGTAAVSSGDPARMNYRVDRLLDAFDIWTTTNTYYDADEFMSPATVRRLTGRSVVKDDGGTMPQIYDAAGQLVTSAEMPSGAIETVNGDAPPVLAGSVAFDPASPLASMPTLATMQPNRVAGSRASSGSVRVAGAVGAGDSATSKRDPREWLDDIVVTPAARGRKLAKLERKFGKAKAKIGKLDRYIERVGSDVVIERLVDADIGAVVEESYAKGGRLTSQRKHTYQRMANGNYLRTKTREETVRRAQPNSTAVVETEFSNVTVVRRATTGSNP